MISTGEGKKFLLINKFMVSKYGWMIIAYVVVTVPIRCSQGDGCYMKRWLIVCVRLTKYDIDDSMTSRLKGKIDDNIVSIM